MLLVVLIVITLSFDRPNWTLLWVLLWLLSIHCCGFFLFTKGFFLTRYEVDTKSQCHSSPSPLPLDLFTQHSQEEDKWCWQPNKYSKAILIIIDALRFEYLAPHHTSEKNHMWDHLPRINLALEQEKERALLFRFRADPPTVTMQRLKGITTGAMPTFIDIRQNFDSSAISEDNFIHQLLQAGKRVTFMGDDTWENLFPQQMQKSWPFPSFNVKDLHTVDNGVLSHLVPEITEGDFDVLIAHFLGVDHVGHRYEVNHPAMADKLKQVNFGILFGRAYAVWR